MKHNKTVAYKGTALQITYNTDDRKFGTNSWGEYLDLTESKEQEAGKLHTKELHSCYSSSYITGVIKENKIGSTCRTWGRW